MDVNVTILLAGPICRNDRDYAEKIAATAKRRGRVHALGSIPHREMPSVFAQATVHALPSWRETPGLVSLEAAAAGCQIVSTSIGSAQEYFGDGAWYCHPADNGTVRAAVLEALEAPRSEDLRIKILEKYTWDAAAKRTVEGYQLAIER